jgi:hypothetical protein
VGATEKSSLLVYANSALLAYREKIYKRVPVVLYTITVSGREALGHCSLESANKIILVVFMTACHYSIYCDLIHNGDATTQNNWQRLLPTSRSK